MQKKIIGRDFNKCDYTIYDPEKRVSKIHLIVEKEGDSFILFDESSTNGTYVNGVKILKNQRVKINKNDKVTLSVDYPLDLNDVYDDDKTSILGASTTKINDDGKTTILNSSNQLHDDDKTNVLNFTNNTNDSDATIVMSVKQESETEKTVIFNASEQKKEVEFINIGRAKTNQIVFSDLKISGNHCKIRTTDNQIIEIIDLGSTNGTFVNNQKLEPKKLYQFKGNVKINLANILVLDLKKIFPNLIIIDSPKTDNQNVKLNVGGKKVVLNSDKTTIGEMLEFETIPFITIGRNASNNIVIDKPKISSYHCKIRLVNPLMFEITDLKSTNGTFANKEKLTPNKSYIFPSNTPISLGVEFLIDLTKILKGIQIIKSPIVEKPKETIPVSAPLSREESESFKELESIWNEFMERQHSIGSLSNNWSIGGAAIGAVASIFLGPAGILVATGSGLMGRYLGMQKAKEIKTDLNYENIFLVTYSCPRCKESFQKRPWVTIRECFKCKVKFREL